MRELVALRAQVLQLDAEASTDRGTETGATTSIHGSPVGKFVSRRGWSWDDDL